MDVRTVWDTVQLGLAFWLIPFAPVSIVAAVAQSQGWPTWAVTLTVLAVTWPVVWFIWLMGDVNAKRR